MGIEDGSGPEMGPEVAGQPESAGERDVYAEMKTKDPERNPLFTAMREIRDPQEMSLFYESYVKFLEKSAQEHPENFRDASPRRTAAGNILYMFNYELTDKRTTDQWRKMIPRKDLDEIAKDIRNES